MELVDVMRTTFAAREFTDDPVTIEVIIRLMENARFAPSGGNRQPWRVVIVRDQNKRRALASSIVPTMKRYAAQTVNGESPWNDAVPIGVSEEEVSGTPPPTTFLTPIEVAPVLLAILADRRVIAAFDRDLDRAGLVSGASIYPFVWNILLAARNEGLGGTCTTFAAANEPAALEILNAPSDLALAALLPLGKPVKQLTNLRRKLPQEFVTLESFDALFPENDS